MALGFVTISLPHGQVIMCTRNGERKAEVAKVMYHSGRHIMMGGDDVVVVLIGV